MVLLTRAWRKFEPQDGGKADENCNSDRVAGECAGPLQHNRHGAANHGSSPLFLRTDNYFKLPNGRHMGSTNTVFGDSHGNIWVAERCGNNDCAWQPA